MDITIKQVMELDNAQRILQTLTEVNQGELDKNGSIKLEKIVDKVDISDAHTLLKTATENPDNIQAIQNYFMDIVKKISYLVTPKSRRALEIFDNYCRGEISFDELQYGLLIAWEETTTHVVTIKMDDKNQNYAANAIADGCAAVFSMGRILVGIHQPTHRDQTNFSKKIFGEILIQQALSSLGRSTAQSLAFDAMYRLSISTSEFDQNIIAQKYLAVIDTQLIEQAQGLKKLCAKLDQFNKAIV